MRHRRLPSGQSGFSLIELMVSITIGLVIVASLAILFANNSRARLETEKSSLQIENGRYATTYLRDELRLAGYFGEFDPRGISMPGAAPDPSATDAASLGAALPVAIQGYHFGKDTTLASTLPSGVSSLLTDLRPNTDVLVVRRTSTCASGPTTAETNCTAMDTSKYQYFQTTLCKSQLSSVNGSVPLAVSAQYVISTSSNVFTTTNPAVTSTPTYLTQKNCSTAAVTRALYVHIFYVANNDATGDGIPTLKMLELGATAFKSPVAIAEGVETLQLEYGTDTNGDGAPDAWTPTPASTGAAWAQVTAVKLHLLVRNPQATGNFTDTRTYVLGGTASTDNTFGPYNDHYKRHLYTSVVRLNNVAGRLE